jgi:hypothetical protein
MIRVNTYIDLFFSKYKYLVIYQWIPTKGRGNFGFPVLVQECGVLSV